MPGMLTAKTSEFKVVRWKNFRESDREDRFIESQIEVKGILYELRDIKESFSTAVSFDSDDPIKLDIGYAVLEKKYKEFYKR